MTEEDLGEADRVLDHVQDLEIVATAGEVAQGKGQYIDFPVILLMLKKSGTSKQMVFGVI